MIELSFPIISVLIALPILGASLIPLIFKTSQKYIVIYAAIISFIELLLSFYAYRLILVNGTGGSYNFIEGPISIIRHFGIDYYVAMDGLSAPLVIITSMLSLLVVIGSRDLISDRKVLYY